MSQALLISDNEIVNSMYEVNLRAYVATNVTIKSSVNKAIELLSLNSSYDAIIIFKELLSDGDSFSRFKTFYENENLEVPLIVLGELKEAFPNSITVKNKYNIKLLLQSMAKILEVTAQEMASLKVSKYFPVPIHLFSTIDQTTCDIFSREKKENLEYDYHLVLGSGTGVGTLYEDSKSNGVRHLYIDSNERLRFINLASRMVITELDRDDLNDSERLEIGQQGMEVVSEEVFANPKITAELAEISKKCIESIGKVVQEAPGIKGLLKLLLENQTDYCYRHSVLTSFVAGEIIDQMSWGTVEQKEKVSFALFFHDLYLLPLYKKYQDIASEEDLLFMDEVEDEDKKTVLEHAKMAGQLIKTFPRCPIGADLILTQHHGMTNGQGFAIHYKDDISPLAKIIIIAEDICTRILSRLKDGEKFHIDKTVIAAELTEKFRGHTYIKIIKAFKSIKV